MFTASITWQVVEKSTVPVKTAEAIEKILTHTKSGVNYEVSIPTLPSVFPEPSAGDERREQTKEHGHKAPSFLFGEEGLTWQ